MLACCSCFSLCRRPVAQWLEQHSHKVRVVGSNPTGPIVRGGQLPKDVSAYGDAYMRANRVLDRVCPHVDNHEHDNCGDTNTETEQR